MNAQDYIAGPAVSQLTQHQEAQRIARDYAFDPVEPEFARCVGAILEAWRVTPLAAAVRKYFCHCRCEQQITKPCLYCLAGGVREGVKA